MTISAARLERLGSMIQSDEDLEAFEAGYELAKDPSNSATFGGRVDGTRDGVYVQINMEDQSGTWLEGKSMPRNQNSALVGDIPFVLGSLIAALEAKHSAYGESGE